MYIFFLDACIVLVGGCLYLVLLLIMDRYLEISVNYNKFVSVKSLEFSYSSLWFDVFAQFLCGTM